MKSTLSVNHLKDLDWRFGVTAASSEVNEVGVTFIQLCLTLDKEGKDKEEKTYVELSLKQFYDLLHQLEKAKTSMDYYSRS